MALLLCMQLAHAAEESPLLEEARRLLAAGQAAESAALLEQQVGSMAGDAEYDYLLGLALYQSGQHGEARFAFERVLMAEPDHADARLKVAFISAERGDVAYASELLAPLSAQQLDSGQRQELERIHAVIAASSSDLTLRTYLQAGIGYDDNVTSGPDARALIIPQLGPQPIPMGTAARAADTVATLGAGGSLQWALGEETWLTGSGTLQQGYANKRKDVAVGYGNVDVGLMTRVGSNYFAAALMGQDYQINRSRYRKTVGWRANWAYVFSDDSLLSAYVQHLSFTFPVNIINEARRTTAGVTRASSLSDGSMLQYGVYGGREIALDVTKPHFSFNIAGAELSASTMMGTDLLLSAAASLESHKHDAVDALFHIPRRDLQWNFGLAADYRLGTAWHLLPRYNFTRNVSNTALNDYTRNTYTLQLRWEFDHASN